MNGINISENKIGLIILTSPDDPLPVAKVKSISNHRWHPVEKVWNFPNTNGTLVKILKVFEGEEIHLDPALQPQLSQPIIARYKVSEQSLHNFEDLRRELVSRKYSYKTVKGYRWYVRNTSNIIPNLEYIRTYSDKNELAENALPGNGQLQKHQEK